MSGKELEKIVDYVDRIKGEWETHVSERLRDFERKSGAPLSEIDDEIKRLLLQHMSWLQDDLHMLKNQLEGIDQLK